MRKIVVKITVRADRFPSLFLSLFSLPLLCVVAVAAQSQSHSRALLPHCTAPSTPPLLPRCALAAPPRHTAINDLVAPLTRALAEPVDGALQPSTPRPDAHNATRAHRRCLTVSLRRRRPLMPRTGHYPATSPQAPSLRGEASPLPSPPLAPKKT